MRALFLSVRAAWWCGYSELNERATTTIANERMCWETDFSGSIWETESRSAGNIEYFDRQKLRKLWNYLYLVVKRRRTNNENISRWNEISFKYASNSELKSRRTNSENWAAPRGNGFRKESVITCYRPTILSIGRRPRSWALQRVNELGRRILSRDENLANEWATFFWMIERL